MRDEEKDTRRIKSNMFEEMVYRKEGKDLQETRRHREGTLHYRKYVDTPHAPHFQ